MISLFRRRQRRGRRRLEERRKTATTTTYERDETGIGRVGRFVDGQLRRVEMRHGECGRVRGRRLHEVLFAIVNDLEYAQVDEDHDETGHVERAHRRVDAIAEEKIERARVLLAVLVAPAEHGRTRDEHRRDPDDGDHRSG